MSSQRHPYSYVADPAALTAATAAGTADKAATTVTKIIQPDSWFVCEKFVGNATGRYQVQIFDEQGAALMNIPIYDVNIVGTAQYPYVLPDPIVFPPTSNLTFQFQDLSGAANTVEFAMVGYKDFDLSQYPFDASIRPPYRREEFDPRFFMYAVNKSVGANASVTGVISVNFGGTFVGRQVMGISNIAATAGAYQVQITKGGANLQTSDALTNQQNAVGTAQLPFGWRQPIVVGNNSVVNVGLKDTSGSTNPIQVVIAGSRMLPQRHEKRQAVRSPYPTNPGR